MSAEALSTGLAQTRPAKPRRRVGYDFPAPKVPYGLIALKVAAIPALITAVIMGRLIATGQFHPTAPHWPNLSLIATTSVVVKVHLATIAGALILGGVLMSGVKGVLLHRVLGWVWSVFMLITAVTALFIPAATSLPHVGRFGVLHLFSISVLVGVPLAIWAARKGRWLKHGKGMSTVFFAGLLVAGLFAFAPGRLLYQVLFG